MEGRCTDTLVDVAPTGGTPDPTVICNTYAVQNKCVANSLCMWRSQNDSCFCSFAGCSCSDPVAGVEKSAGFAAQTMMLVVIPCMIVFVLVCIGVLFSPCGSA
jgi:hypothetical protein